MQARPVGIAARAACPPGTTRIDQEVTVIAKRFFAGTVVRKKAGDHGPAGLYLKLSIDQAWDKYPGIVTPRGSLVLLGPSLSSLKVGQYMAETCDMRNAVHACAANEQPIPTLNILEKSKS